MEEQQISYPAGKANLIERRQDEMIHIFDKHTTSTEIKLDNFERYARRQKLARFIARYELFKKIINIKGSIIECGVHHGGGLIGWGKISAALEPYGIHRKVIGFDTFEGFPNIHDQDKGGSANTALVKKGFSAHTDTYTELEDCIKEFDDNRFLNQFPKVELVKGDATQTIPEFIENNKHVIISLLFMDFDLYEPTKVALDHFLPRVPKGGIIAFDEINNQFWPGETVALLEKTITLNNLSVKKFNFDPNIAYIQL